VDGRSAVVLIGVQIFVAVPGSAQTGLLPDPPQVSGKNHVVSLTLHAVNENGRDAFAFNGETVAPVIRACGESLHGHDEFAFSWIHGLAGCATG